MTVKQNLGGTKCNKETTVLTLSVAMFTTRMEDSNMFCVIFVLSKDILQIYTPFRACPDPVIRSTIMMLFFVFSCLYISP